MDVKRPRISWEKYGRGQKEERGRGIRRSRNEEGMRKYGPGVEG